MSSSPARSLRRAATALAATTLVALPTPAGATSPTPSAGRASAVTAEVDLHVSLLNSTVDVPVDLALNKVQSPAEHNGSVLSANVAGVAQPGPVTLVKADVGNSVTHVDAQGASASVRLVNADVHAPGLPASTLLGLEALSTEVSCPVDGPPTAKVTAPAKLTVLGHAVTLSLYGPTHVDVPAIGSVDIEFSQHSTTTTTAAASALTVKVALNPLNLNVAKVDGTITVASVSCEKPGGAASSPGTSGVPTAGTPAPAQVADASAAATPAAPSSAAPAVRAAPAPASASASSQRAGSPGARSAADPQLASTGSSSTGPLLGGGAALLVIGGGALGLAARRRRPAGRRN